MSYMHIFCIFAFVIYPLFVGAEDQCRVENHISVAAGNTHGIYIDVFHSPGRTQYVYFSTHTLPHIREHNNKFVSHILMGEHKQARALLQSWGGHTRELLQSMRDGVSELKQIPDFNQIRYLGVEDHPNSRRKEYYRELNRTMYDTKARVAQYGYNQDEVVQFMLANNGHHFMVSQYPGIIGLPVVATEDYGAITDAG